MTKSITVVLMSLLISGCYQSVDSYDIKRSIKECGSIENVYTISADAFGVEWVTCFEGGEK